MSRILFDSFDATEIATAFGKVCISDAWKDVSAMFVCVNETWKQATLANVCVGEGWKTLV